jgi:hypothetical protein
MLKVITDEAVISKCHAAFTRSFKPFIDKRILVNLGHQGASIRAKVSWSGRLGIWLFSTRLSDNRYWNALGIVKPETSMHIPITCEINFPHAGIDRRIGGVMAIDRTGRIFIVHRGKIGGGKKGIGKSLFENSYHGSWTLLEEGDSDSLVALIGELKSPRFVRQVTQFVRKVNAIKDSATTSSNQLTFPFDSHGLKEELIGDSQNSPTQDEHASCDYGLVVLDLYAVLKREGFRPGNSDSHDLYTVSDNDEMEIIFSVSSENDARAINSAAMKLLIGSSDYQRKPSLVLVVPSSIDKSLLNSFPSLGIQITTYDWDCNGEAVFSNIPILKR